MDFKSDDQRKAMFARLRGGGSGGSTHPIWVFPPPKPPKPPKQPKPPTQPGTPPPNTAPIHHDIIPGTTPVTGGGIDAAFGGIPFIDYGFTFDTNIGLSSTSDWLSAYSTAQMPNFNLFANTLGWDPPNWTTFFFENTVFEGLIGSSAQPYIDAYAQAYVDIASGALKAP